MNTAPGVYYVFGLHYLPVLPMILKTILYGKVILYDVQDYYSIKPRWPMT